MSAKIWYGWFFVGKRHLEDGLRVDKFRAVRMLELWIRTRRDPKIYDLFLPNNKIASQTTIRAIDPARP